MKRKEDFKWTQINHGYQYSEVESNYGKIKQRWLLIFSEQAYKREAETFERNLKKKQSELEKFCWHEGNKVYNCIPDAEKEVKKSCGKTKII